MCQMSIDPIPTHVWDSHSNKKKNSCYQLYAINKCMKDESEKISMNYQ